MALIKPGKHRKGYKPVKRIKQWKPIFSTRRPLKDSPFFEVCESLDEGVVREVGPLETFLEDDESSIPSWERRVILQSLPTEGAQNRPARNLARARLDDREYDSGRHRQHPEWLTSNQLREALLLPRFGSSKLPNADRRLIYIHQLDPEHVLALIKTIYFYQADALRDALWKHLSFKTAIQVTLPLHNNFVLEFHLPFLTLRNRADVMVDRIRSGGNQSSRTEIDVCFLNLECRQHQGGGCSCKHIIQESQISVVVSGWDNYNWSAWGFFNTPWYHNDDCDHDNKVDSTDLDDEALDVDTDDEEMVNEDYFVADGDRGTFLDANSPIWDPRCYWLSIIDFRVRRVLKEWTWLVRNVEAGVNDWKMEHPVLRTDISKDRHEDDIKQLFEWTIHSTQLLGKLRQRFGRTTQAWSRFSSANGDQCYFSDMADQRSLLALENLKRSFQGLEDLQQDLVSLDKSCRESRAILSLCLEHESNRVNSESQELNRRAHSLNLQTNLISRDIQGLNRTGTEAAVQTVHAARDTSRATRSNVMLIWITTPLILALQYFGAEKDIFPFQRNTQNFIIALVVLIFALPCLAYFLEYLFGVGEEVRARLGIRPRKKGNKAEQSDVFELQPQLSTVAVA